MIALRFFVGYPGTKRKKKNLIRLSPFCPEGTFSWRAGCGLKTEGTKDRQRWQRSPCFEEIKCITQTDVHTHTLLWNYCLLAAAASCVAGNTHVHSHAKAQTTLTLFSIFTHLQIYENVCRSLVLYHMKNIFTKFTKCLCLWPVTSQYAIQEPQYVCTIWNVNNLGVYK